MPLFDHHAFELSAIPAVCLVLGWWLWRAVKPKRGLLRRPVRVAATLLQLSSCLLLFVNGCVPVTTITEKSAPIYSPDGRRAIIVRTWDAGALGGATWVDLYSYAGLLEQNLASGEWKVIDAKDVHWLANDKVRFGFEPSYRAGANCVSTRSVTVVCEPNP